MANNGGRQGGGGSGGNDHVEFTVKAEEDLYLVGSESTIRRVTAETNYSCLMLKGQRFSSLFRHYAKYHGLRKEDLEYYFVNPLGNEDTPESVQLQRGDTIMVRKRRKPEPPEVAADDDEFWRDMRVLLADEEHMDVAFVVHQDGNSSSDVEVKPGEELPVGSVLIRAHKCVLTARSEYFKAHFRKAADRKAAGISFSESNENTIVVEPEFGPNHIQHLIEFIYTNRVMSIHSVQTDDLLTLLHLSDKWLLRDLKRIVEHELIRNHMSVHNVARMYGATEDFNAQRLARACIEFIMANLRQVAGSSMFEEEMKNYPKLCIPIMKAAADMIPEGPVHKKQRTEHGSSATAPTAPASATPPNIGSSPVPDSDP
eukprot:Nitzschia sp. Nitz4//scaffold290_size23356//6768//7963//NITZ4_008487-RA/size23356-augustus-gene-0.34-mRNA-1//-1//CDS//3329546090//8308//frame0